MSHLFPANIGDLFDVDLTGISLNDILQWDGTYFVPVPSGGGADGNGIFDATNDGGTVPAAFDALLTDTLTFTLGTDFDIGLGVNNAAINFQQDLTTDYYYKIKGDSPRLTTIDLTLNGSVTGAEGTIYSFITNDAFLGDGVRPDSMLTFWAFNLEGNSAGTSSVIVDPTDAALGARVETHYRSAETNPTNGKDTMEFYHFYVDNNGLGGTRPIFWAANKDGTWSYWYHSAHMFQWMNYARDKVLIRLDDVANRLTIGEGTSGNVDMYFDYNQATYIKGKTAGGQLANIIGFDSSDQIELGGSNVTKVIIPRQTEIDDPLLPPLIIQGVPNYTTPPNTNKKLVWDNVTGIIGFTDEEPWIDEANNYNMYFSLFNGEYQYGFNDNAFDCGFSFLHTDPTLGLKDSGYSPSANLQTASGFPDKLFLKIGPIHPTEGGAYFQSSTNTTSPSTIGEWHKVYLENQPDTFGGYVFDTYKHDGLGALTGIDDGSYLVSVRNNNTSMFTIRGDGSTSVGSSISLGKFTVNQSGTTNTDGSIVANGSAELRSYFTNLTRANIDVKTSGGDTAGEFVFGVSA